MSLGLRKALKGISLFEVLGALMIAGAASVASFKYQQYQRENAIAEVLANQMYLFSQTVQQYVLDHQTDMAAGTFAPSPPVPAASSFEQAGNRAEGKTYVFTGVSWLSNPKTLRSNSNTPYFSTPMTFSHLSPLQLTAANGIKTGDDVIKVTITGSQITIEYGMLYLPGAGKQKALPRVAVTGNAAAMAGRMFDPLLGPSSFTYTGGIDQDGNVIPITAVSTTSFGSSTYVVPTVKSAVQVGVLSYVESGLPTPGNIIFDDSTAPDAYGQQSAQIKYVRGIQFNPTSKAEVTEMKSLSFHRANLPPKYVPPTPGAPLLPLAPPPILAPEVPGVIDNMGAVNFALNGTINGLTTMNFEQGGVITRLGTINFAPTGTQNNITNLNTLNIVTSAGTQPFAGINVETIESFYSDGTPNAKMHNAGSVLSHAAGQVTTTNSLAVMLSSGMAANTSTHFCSLSTVQFMGGNGNSQACQLYVDGGGNYAVNVQQMLGCAVICFRFVPVPPPSASSPVTQCTPSNPC